MEAQCSSRISDIAKVTRVPSQQGWGEAVSEACTYLNSTYGESEGLQVLLIIPSSDTVERLSFREIPSNIRMNALQVCVKGDDGALAAPCSSLSSFCGRTGGLAQSVGMSWDAAFASPQIDVLIKTFYDSSPLTLRVGALSAAVRLDPHPSQCTPSPPISSLDIVGFVPADRTYVAGASVRLAVLGATSAASSIFAALLAALQSQQVLAVVSLGGDQWACIGANPQSPGAAVLMLWPDGLASTWAAMLAGRAPLSSAPAYAAAKDGIMVSASVVPARVRRLARMCKALPAEAPDLVSEINGIFGAARLLALEDPRGAILEQLGKAKTPSEEAAAIVAHIVKQVREAKVGDKIELEAKKAPPSKKRSSIAALLNDKDE